MPKRTHTGSPAGPQAPAAGKLAAAPESHSGEGSASVLATLQKMQTGRSAMDIAKARPVEEPASDQDTSAAS